MSTVIKERESNRTHKTLQLQQTPEINLRFTTFYMNSPARVCQSYVIITKVFRNGFISADIKSFGLLTANENLIGMLFFGRKSIQVRKSLYQEASKRFGYDV